MAMVLVNNNPVNYAKIAECLKYKTMAMHNAFTIKHPAYRKYVELWNELNDNEAKLCYAISPITDYAILG